MVSLVTLAFQGLEQADPLDTQGGLVPQGPQATQARAVTQALAAFPRRRVIQVHLGIAASLGLQVLAASQGRAGRQASLDLVAIREQVVLVLSQAKVEQAVIAASRLGQEQADFQAQTEQKASLEHLEHLERQASQRNLVHRAILERLHSAARVAALGLQVSALIQAKVSQVVSQGRQVQAASQV